jgi:translation initiation factor IF-3
MAYPKRGRGTFKPEPKHKHRINNDIRAREVRLIDADGSQAGIKPVTEALRMAQAQSLDLVEVAPEAKPPVCKILAYSKFKYEQDKKLRESRKHQKAGLLKEVRFSPIIGSHDLDVKIRHATEFLKAHDKVRFTVFFRGRQNKHEDIGFRLLKSVEERLADIATVESRPVKDRNRMSMTLAPKR